MGKEVLLSARNRYLQSLGAYKLTPKCIWFCAAVVQVGDVAYRLAVPDSWRILGAYGFLRGT